MEQSNIIAIDTALEDLRIALRKFYSIDQIHKTFPVEEHIEKTPTRIVNSMMELFRGCWQNPEEELRTAFMETSYDEMIFINDIPFVSSCAHHQLPFVGKAHFAYIPNGKIVGLSKVPRLIDAYAYRPQIQEKLTVEIVHAFNTIIQPKGCGLVVEAHHFCMMVRGAESSPSYAKTQALRGVFKTSEVTRNEFLNGIRKTTEKIWP